MILVRAASVQSLRRRFLLLLLLAAAATTTTAAGGNDKCPAACVCTRDNTDVDCSNAGLTAVPKVPLSVQKLVLANNKIVLTSGSFAGLSQLTSLDLSSNSLERLNEGVLASMPLLRRLRLANNRLNGGSAFATEAFRLVRAIEELDLSGNSQLFAAPVALRLLSDLRSLDLSASGIRDVAMALGPELAVLERLDNLVLSRNDLGRLLKDSFESLVRNSGGGPKRIFLADCKLTAIETGAFSKLRSVVELDLSGNAVTLGDLKQVIVDVGGKGDLERLALARMNISSLGRDGAGSDDSLLLGLRSSGQLKHLDLSGNRFASLGRSHFRAVKGIEELDLSGNRVEVLENGNFNGLSSLKRLALARNRIKSVGQFAFDGEHVLLESVDLSGNRLSTLAIDDFSQLFSLKRLNVSDNAIGDVLPFSSLESLEELIIAGNRLSNLSHLMTLGNLQRLDASRNLFVELPAKFLWPFLHLRTLNLSRNRIADVDPAAFTSVAPQIIDLSFNRITYIRDFGWTGTEHLLLRGNAALYVAPSAFRTIGSWLRELDLGENALEVIDSTSMADLTRLSILRLDGNHLAPFLQSDAGRAVFAVLSGGNGGIVGDSRIEELDLSRNAIERTHDGFFRNLTRLRILSLAANRISSVSERQMAGLNSLERLDLSANNLSRVPAMALRALSNLARLNFSSNPIDCSGCTLMSSAAWGSAQLRLALVGYAEDRQYVCAVPSNRLGLNLYDVASEHAALDGCSLSGGGSTADNSEEKKIILIVIGCTAFVILIVAGVIFWHHRWRLKKKLQKQHYKTTYELGRRLPPQQCEAFLPPPPALPPATACMPSTVYDGSRRCGVPAYV